MAADVQSYSLTREEGRAFWFFDTLILVRATGEQTGGMLGMIEQVLPGTELGFPPAAPAITEERRLLSAKYDIEVLGPLPD